MGYGNSSGGSHESEAPLANRMNTNFLSAPKRYNREKKHYDDYSHRLNQTRMELDMMEVRKDAAIQDSENRISTRLKQTSGGDPSR